MCVSWGLFLFSSCPSPNGPNSPCCSELCQISRTHSVHMHILHISSLSPDHWWACLSGMWRQLRLLGNASVEKQENLPAPPPLTETFFWDSSQRIKILISYLFWNSWTYPWSSSSKERNQHIQLASSTIEFHFPGSYLELEGIHFTGSFLFELGQTHIFIGQGCLSCFVSQISQYAWFLQA